MYESYYHHSWALIVGINDYAIAAPLSFACNDADSVANVLSERFDFPDQNVTVLKDAAATKQRIMDTYLGFARLADNPNDRVLVFFAGHGLTLERKRREVGYLVLVYGDPSNLNSLIRWDELTWNSDLILAKHMLFIMDACYSDLMLKRVMPPGVERFVSNMLQRSARQVITAG